MRRLTLIRHGLTEGNVRRWYYGALDLPLCEAGQAAVQEAAAGGLYPPYSGERILTSGMLRTEQTLRLIYGEAPHEIWPELREISFGIFEGKSYDELKGLAEYEAWLAGDWFRNVPPGGESFAQAEARILSALSRMRAHMDGIYTGMLLTGTLEPHLAEIGESAQAMFDRLVEQMKKAEGVTEQLKAADQMEWVGRMNSIRQRAEEVVLSELVYC